MEQLLNPRLDIVFKMLFTQDNDILIDLLNGVLEFPPDHLIQKDGENGYAKNENV